MFGLIYQLWRRTTGATGTPWLTTTSTCREFISNAKVKLKLSDLIITEVAKGHIGIVLNAMILDMPLICFLCKGYVLFKLARTDKASINLIRTLMTMTASRKE